MFVQVVSLFLLTGAVRGQFGRAGPVCQANYLNRCCLSAYWPTGQCDDMILDTTIPASEGQTLSLQADPRIDWTAGTTMLGACTWYLPGGLECSFVSNSLETSCRGAPEVRWAGDFRNGQCYITVDNVNQQKHGGSWKCSMNIGYAFNDYVRVEVTTGMPASKALAISLPIVAIAVIAIVIVICFFFPTLCLSCACLMCAPCRDKAEREQKIRKDKNKANRPLPNIHAMEAGSPEVTVPLRAAMNDGSSSSNAYANDSIESSYRNEHFSSGGRIAKGFPDAIDGLEEGGVYDAVQYTQATPTRPNLVVAGSGQTKTARKISNNASLQSFGIQPHHEGVKSTIH